MSNQTDHAELREYEKTETGMMVSLLGVAVAVLLSLTGAWAYNVNENQKKFEDKGSQLELKISKTDTQIAVQQEQLKSLNEKMDKVLLQLDKLADRK